MPGREEFARAEPRGKYRADVFIGNELISRFHATDYATNDETVALREAQICADQINAAFRSRLQEFREECAQIAEGMDLKTDFSKMGPHGASAVTAQNIADAIRRLGGPL